MDGPEPYKFIWLEAMDGHKPYKFIGFGAKDDPKCTANYLKTSEGAGRSLAVVDDAAGSLRASCDRVFS